MEELVIRFDGGVRLVTGRDPWTPSHCHRRELDEGLEGTYRNRVLRKEPLSDCTTNLKIAQGLTRVVPRTTLYFFRFF